MNSVRNIFAYFQFLGFLKKGSFELPVFTYVYIYIHRDNWKITILCGVLVGNIFVYVLTDFLNTTTPFSRCLYGRSPECV